VRFANHDQRLVLVTETDADLTPTIGLDVARASRQHFDSDPQAAFDRWPELLEWARSVDPEAVAGARNELVPGLLGAPAPRPRQVFAIGLNYADHAAESRMEASSGYPSTFTKFRSSLAGPFCEIELPSGSVDWEVELVTVIGREARGVEAVDAWNYVAGLTVGQDLSERSVQLAGSAPQFSLGKSFPNFGPTGPSLVIPDVLSDLSDLRLETRIDDQVMQAGRTSGMIFDVPTLVERLSRIVTLLPGDLIFTGTPGGVGAVRNPPRFLVPGDTLTSEIQGIGRMRHTFRGRAS
jgi:2-keto-4-pentenoate hydratase/2-oxohepta-3-ene-1,7-dioic acid hydratase in catechol pathway